MARKRCILKSISLAIAAIFLVQQVVWAAGDTPAEAARAIYRQNGVLNSAGPLSIRVPSQLAQVDEVRVGENGETIINIQDCHSSLSAQYSIVKLLDELMKNYNLELVSIEGASGYIDTSMLKSHPDSRTKEKTAAFLMKEGKISAGEFFSVVNDGNVALYGAEDNALYCRNLKCFRDIYARNRDNTAVLDSVLESLKRAEDRVYTKELATFVYKARLHRLSKISFDVYWSFLGDACRRNGVATEAYRNIESYRNSVRMEKDINFKLATKERGALLDRLMKQASREDLEEMVVKSLAFEKGSMDQYDFHKWVISAAVAKGIDPAEYPELAKYGDYVTNYRSLDIIGLQKDIDDAEARLLEKLFTSGKERRLYRIVKTAELLKSLFEIKLMNGEVVFVKDSLSSVTAKDFSEFMDADVPAGIENRIENVLSEAKSAIKFYEIAEERDKAMIANTVSSMRREGKKVAALISGGHHSEGLTSLMKENGLSYLVLMPKYTDDNLRPYVAVLTKKTGPYREMAAKGDYNLALEAYFDTGDISRLEEMIAYAAGQSAMEGKDFKAEAMKWAAGYRAAYGNISSSRREAMAEEPVKPEIFEAKLAEVVPVRTASDECEVRISGNLYKVTQDSLEVERISPAKKTAVTAGSVMTAFIGRIKALFAEAVPAALIAGKNEKDLKDFLKKAGENDVHFAQLPGSILELSEISLLRAMVASGRDVSIGMMPAEGGVKYAFLAGTKDHVGSNFADKYPQYKFAGHVHSAMGNPLERAVSFMPSYSDLVSDHRGGKFLVSEWGITRYTADQDYMKIDSVRDDYETYLKTAAFKDKETIKRECKELFELELEFSEAGLSPDGPNVKYFAARKLGSVVGGTMVLLMATSCSMVTEIAKSDPGTFLGLGIFTAIAVPAMILYLRYKGRRAPPAEFRPGIAIGADDVSRITTIRGGSLNEEEKKEAARVLMMHIPELAGMHIVIDASEKSRKGVSALKLGFDERSRTVTLTAPYPGFTSAGAESLDMGSFAGYFNDRKIKAEKKEFADGSPAGIQRKEEVLAWIDEAIARSKSDGIFREMLYNLRREYASEKGIVSNTPDRPLEKEVSAHRGVFRVMNDNLSSGAPLCLAANYAELVSMPPADRDNIFMHEAAHLTPRARAISLELKKSERLARAYPDDTRHLKRFLALAVQSEFEPEIARIAYLKNIILNTPQEELYEYFKAGFSPAKRKEVIFGLAGSFDMSEQRMSELLYREIIRKQGRFLRDIGQPDLNKLESSEGLGWLTGEGYVLSKDNAPEYLHAFDYTNSKKWSSTLYYSGSLISAVSLIALAGAGFARLDMLAGLMCCTMAAGVYLSIASYRFDLLAKAVYSGLSGEGLSEDKIKVTPIAQRIGGIVSTEPHFEYLTDKQKEMILFHEFFPRHFIGMVALMPGLYWAGRIILWHWFMKKIEVVKQSDFSNLKWFVNNLQEKAGKGQEQSRWTVSYLEDNSILRKQYLPVRGGSASADAGEGSVTRRTGETQTGLSRGKRIKDWMFTAEAKKNLPIHTDVKSTLAVGQGTTNKKFYRDAFEMLSNLGEERILWTNELSADKGQTLHFHLFDMLEPLPIERYAQDPVFTTRRGEVIVSKVRTYPDSSGSIAVYAVKGDISDPEKIALTSARCYDMEMVIKQHSYAVDKVFVPEKGNKNKVTVYFFPRRQGYAKFFDFDRNPRSVGPLAMSGHWILGSFTEHSNFKMSNIRRILMNVGMPANSYNSARMDAAITRNFEEAEGTGVLPPVVTYRPFDGISPGGMDEREQAVFIEKQKRIIDGLSAGGVRRFNYALEMSEEGINDPFRWKATVELLKYAKLSGMTTVLSMRSLVTAINRLDDRWGEIKEGLLPYVDKISFMAQGTSPRLETTIEKFKTYCKDKRVEIFTEIDSRNTEEIFRLGEYLREKFSQDINKMEWEISFARDELGRRVISEDAVRDIETKMTEKFVDLPVDYATYSREETELKVSNKGIMTAPAVAGPSWIADIMDQSSLDLDVNKAVFKRITNNVRKMSTYIPIDEGSLSLVSGPSVETAGELIPSVAGLIFEPMRGHIAAEEKIASAVASKMGVSPKYADALKLAVWAHHVGEDPRKRYQAEHDAMRKALRDEYPQARAKGGEWHIFLAVQAIMKEKMADNEDRDRKFEIFCEKMAELLGIDELTPVQEIVARSMFDAKRYGADRLREEGMSLPVEVTAMMDYYGEYGRFKDNLSTAYKGEASADEMLKMLAAIRIARIITNKNDAAFQEDVRREKICSYAECLNFTINNLKVNGEYSKDTRDAISAMLELVKDGDGNISAAMDTLREKGDSRASVSAEDRIFLNFLRTVWDVSEGDPEKIASNFEIYRHGPSLRKYAKWPGTFTALGGLFVATAVLSASWASTWPVLWMTFMVSMGMTFYLLSMAKSYRLFTDGIMGAMRKAWKTKDPSTLMDEPIVKIMPDGSIDKSDPDTKSLMEALDPETIRKLRALQLFETADEAVLVTLPVVFTTLAILNTGKLDPDKARDAYLTKLHTARLKKIYDGMLIPESFSHLKHALIKDRKSEMHPVTYYAGDGGETWEWNDGDGVALVAFAGGELASRIAELQEKLRSAIGGNEDLFLTPEHRLHITVGEVIKNTPGTHSADLAPMRRSYVERTREIAENNGALGMVVNFNPHDVTIRPDGAILMLGTIGNMKVEGIRDDIETLAIEANSGQSRRSDILHITVGRIFKENINEQEYNRLKRVVEEHKKDKSLPESLPLSPKLEIGVWDQGKPGNFKYHSMVRGKALSGEEKARELLEGKRPAEKAPDLKGEEAPSTNPVIQELIRSGRMVEVFIENGIMLAARKVKWVEGYKPGKASSADYLGDEVDIGMLFTETQRKNMLEWMKARKLPDDRGNVRFRVALDEAALGWRNDEEHSNISHAGRKDGVIYIGERLLGAIFERPFAEERRMILDEDEYRHLTEPDFDCTADDEAYARRLMTAGSMINRIICEPSKRHGLNVCLSGADAAKAHKGTDRYDGRIRWGNFTPVKTPLEVDNMAPVPVTASLYIQDACGIKQEDLRMKIWMGPDDNYYRWSEQRMQLVYSNPVEGGYVYYFAGETPMFFQGDFTFKYSIDGGKTWRWANNGSGDNKTIRRKELREVKPEKGGYGLWRNDEKGPAYKRTKVLKLYNGEVNLRSLVEEARSPEAMPTDDAFWKGWDIGPEEAKNFKAIHQETAVDDDGEKEGRVLLYYDEAANTLVIKMSSIFSGDIIPGSNVTFGDMGWYKATIEIPLSADGSAKEVIHKREVMGISRSGIALLLKHARFTGGKFEELYKLLQQELVLYPVLKEMKLREMYDTQAVEIGPMAAIMRGEDVGITEDDITKLENIINFARSRSLTRLALVCLESLADQKYIEPVSDQKSYRKDLYREKERYVIEKMVLEGMACVEREIRQDRKLLKEMGIDRNKVASVSIRWFTGNANKAIYRVTFRMTEGPAKVFAMEFMSPVFIGKDFVRTNIEKTLNLWGKMSDQGADFVPHVFAVKRINDYKPKVLDAPLPEAEERGDTEFEIDPAIVEPDRVVYDDTILVAREFVEGQEVVDYRAFASASPEEEKRVYQAGLKAYFKMWKSTKDPVTGRGMGLLDPSPRNVVVYMVSQDYQGVVSEMETLTYGLSLMGLMRSLAAAGHSKEDVLEAAKGILSNEECAALADDYEKAAAMGEPGRLTEERPFLRATYEAPEGVLANMAEDISTKDFDSAVIELSGEQQRNSMHNIKGALNYIAEKVNRNTDISRALKENINLAIDQMRRREIWSKVHYYDARHAHGFGTGDPAPVLGMLYAFKKEEMFYLAEGFLDWSQVAREDCVADILLRHVLEEMITEGGPTAIEEAVRTILGDDYEEIEQAIKKYAAKSYIKCVIEDDVLGIGPEKDLVSYQAQLPGDILEARRNAEEYLETVYNITLNETAGKTVSTRSELAAYLTKRFGIRKFVIAGGKGTRFSPEGIVVKQLFMPDNHSTNIKLSRISAAFGKLDDVIVVDTVTAFKILKKDIPISDDTKNLMMKHISKVFAKLIDAGTINRQEAGIMVGNIRSRLKTELKDTRRDDGLMDLAMITRSTVSVVTEAIQIVGKISAEQAAKDQRVQFVADKISYGIFKAVLEDPNVIDEERKDEILGKNCRVILDSGDGHGSAYMEALKELDDAGKLSEARYSIIVHADSPGWGLDKYPNSVFIAYLKTVNQFSPSVSELPKVTIAVKNPMDGRAKGRARIYVERTDQYGLVPSGLKEWNEMSDGEKEEALNMAQAKSPNLLTNANIFICDTPWALSRSDTMREKYKHLLGAESKKKRRAYEYWSSDLVNIGAQEFAAQRALDKNAAPVVRLVHLGHRAPNANKTLQYALEYRDDLQEMLIDKIKALGVDVDKGATVSISGDNIGPDFDWDKVVRSIFADNIECPDENIGNIRIRGAVHLSSGVRIGKGAILDGTKQDIWLMGTTTVGRGVEIQGVVAKDKKIDKDELYKEDKILLAGFPMSGSRTMEATLVRGVNLSQLGFVSDSRTKIWLVKSDRTKSDKDVLLEIFGSDIEEGRVRDQIFLYGDIILEDTARVENGTMLDGRAGQITLLGKTVVRKGTVLKSVKARDTVFASRRGLDIYYYKQPTTIQESFWLSDSVFENSFIEWGAKVQHSTVVNSVVASRASVLESDVINDIVIFDSPVEGQRREDKEALLASVIEMERDGEGRVKYVAGAFRLDEFEEAEREEIKQHQLKSAKAMYRMFINDPVVLARMDEDTARFLASPATGNLTVQQIREYFFAKVRENSRKYTGKEPAFENFKPIVAQLRSYTAKYMEKAAALTGEDSPEARKLFREVVLLSARFNLFDPSVDTKRLDVLGVAKAVGEEHKGLQEVLDRETETTPGIDAIDQFEKMVFEGDKGTFLFITDNSGEVEADAVLWEFLLKMGHKVVVAPKGGFAFGDADVEGVREIIDHYDGPGGLKEYASSGSIKTISSGSLGEGVMLHKISVEMRDAMSDPGVKAIICKGQANVFTLSSRNRLKAAVVVMLLHKSMTSSKITGIPLLKGHKFWPIIAVLDKDENKERMRILNEGAGRFYSSFTGSLSRFGKVNRIIKSIDKEGHAFSAVAGIKWGMGVLSFTVAAEVLLMGINYFLGQYLPPWVPFAEIGAISFLALGSLRYFLLARETYNAMVRYIFQGRSPDDTLDEDAASVEQAKNTDIAFRASSGIIKYHPAFRELDSTVKVFGVEVIGPERAQELIRIHESFKMHNWGMFAIFPIAGLLVRALHRVMFPGEYQGAEMAIHSDHSNIGEVLDKQILENVKRGFLNRYYMTASEEEAVDGEPRLVKILDKALGNDVIDQPNIFEKGTDRCNFCDRPFLSSEAPRSRTEDWAFTVEPSPVFDKQVIALSARHVPQSRTTRENYYDALRMIHSLRKVKAPGYGGVTRSWQISWPSGISTTMPDHLHFHLFLREKPVPIESYEAVPLCSDREGNGVVFSVQAYPDKANAVAAFMVKGRADLNLELFAKRCADLDDIIRNSGYETDKFITKDSYGMIKVFFYPRTAEVIRYQKDKHRKMMGPAEMSGIWAVNDQMLLTQFGAKDVHQALRAGALNYYSGGYGDLAESIKRHFFESEGVGLFPPSMDMMVTYDCNLNCPVCWGSYMPKYRIFAPSDTLLAYVDFSKGTIGRFATYDFAFRAMPGVAVPAKHAMEEPLREGTPAAKELEVIRRRLGYFFNAERGYGRITYIGFSQRNKHFTIKFEGRAEPVEMAAGDDVYTAAVLDFQKKMIDAMYDNGMRRMVFTGGEPLLERALPELLKHAKAKGITTWLFTNGILMTEEKASAIMPYVDSISLSLDGYDDATNSVNRKPGHFDAVMRVLDILKRNYPDRDVQVLTVVTNRNKEMVRKIGSLLRQATSGLKNFKWKLNYYKRIGRSHEEVEVQKDVYLMKYDDFKNLAISTEREFSDMTVRYSPPEHDKAYLFVFPDGTLATTVHADYLELGNVLEPDTLANEENVRVFREITGAIRQRSKYIQKGIFSAPDFKRRNLMGPAAAQIIDDLHKGLASDITEHTARVVGISSLIAARLNEKGVPISDHYMNVLKAAAMVHDIGAQEKYEPELKDALIRINNGIHSHKDERVEPTTVCLFEWVSAKAMDNPRIPKKELIEAFNTARQEGDYYPLYKLYIKYVILERAPEEDLANDEERVARNLFSHGRNSVEKLREKGIEFPVEVGLLVEFHHDYNALDVRLKDMVAEKRIDQEKADMVRLLATVIIVADVVEMGNNYKRRVEMKRIAIEDLGDTLDIFNGFLWKRFNQMERIPDRRAIEAFKDLLIAGRSPSVGEEGMSPKLAIMLAQARRAPLAGGAWLKPEDKRMLQRMSAQRRYEMSFGQASYDNARPDIAIGIPSDIYNKLTRDQVEDLRDATGIAALIPLGASKNAEQLIRELSERTKGAASVTALIDYKAVPPEAGGEEIVRILKPILEQFAEKARRDWARLANPEIGQLSESDVRAIKQLRDVEKVMMVLMRTIPNCRSYRMTEKSVRQMRIERTYYEYYDRETADTGRVEYIADAINDSKPRYLVHFADAADVVSGKSPLVLPPGLEIQKRREAQKVDRKLDVYKDKFFVVAPRYGMSSFEKEKFRKKVMRTWMLDGIIPESDVVILERKNAPYTTTEIFSAAKIVSEGITPVNSGIRVLAGKLEYDLGAIGEELLQVDVDPQASSNVNQYEVFVNLIVSKEDNSSYIVDGLKHLKGRYYRYLPPALPIDLQGEIKSYYDRYVREVMVRA